MTVEVRPLPCHRPLRVGDDLVDALLDACGHAGQTLVDGDVVCVASKVVALTEGRLVPVDSDPHARRRLATEHADGIVADAPQVLVTRTRHGFVVANSGIDQSNVDDGHALLLPEDPDLSARQLRHRLLERIGVDVGVIVTDTFGRPWRVGQTDVAIGASGAPVLRDERGQHDLQGHELDVTVAAVADEIAGASDLVRSKASATPFVLVRGAIAGTHGSATDLVRPAELDLFSAGGPTAAVQAVLARRTVRAFDTERPVPRRVLRAAVEAAASAPAPHHTRPWRFVRLHGETRTRLLDAMAWQWREDLVGDGTPAATIERRLRRSDAILRDAPELLAAFVVLDGAHHYPDERRTTAERDLFVLSAGAALQNAQVVLSGHGVGAAWISSTAFCAPTVRTVLELDGTWEPVGMLAIGWPADDVAPRDTPTIDDLLIE